MRGSCRGDHESCGPQVIEEAQCVQRTAAEYGPGHAR